MAVVSWTQEVSSPVAPARLFKALSLDSHNLFPKLMPEVFKSIEFVKGDRVVVGAIKQINFPEGSPFKYVKHKIEEVDVEKMYCKYSTPEGDVLGEKVDNVVHEVKLSPSGTGTVCTMSWHYYPKGGAVLDEEMIKKGQGQVVEMVNKVGQFLLANPTAYD